MKLVLRNLLKDNRILVVGKLNLDSSKEASLLQCFLNDNPPNEMLNIHHLLLIKDGVVLEHPSIFSQDAVKSLFFVKDDHCSFMVKKENFSFMIGNLKNYKLLYGTKDLDALSALR